MNCYCFRCNSWFFVFKQTTAYEMPISDWSSDVCSSDLDMRIAASDAMMTTAYVRLALSGDFGCTYFLTRLVGPAIAAELMFLSEKIAMDRALQLGLVNRVMPSGDLLAEGLRIDRKSVV